MALAKSYQRVLMCLCLGLSGIGSSQAEITILDGQDSGPWWQRLGIELGGSIRPQYSNVMGSVDDGSYKHKGYDGGSRLRLHGHYYFNDDISLVVYYEPGLDVPQILGMHKHYDPDDQRVRTRQLYYGFESKTWGKLTYGKQENPYYSAIGVKTDVWDNDMNAQGPGAGLDGDYDGTYHGRKTLNYSNTFGPLDLYLSGALPAPRKNQGNGMLYRRRGGGAIGLNYHLTDAIELAASYNYTNSDVLGNGNKRNEDQHIAGLALSYESGPWYGAFTGGYYRNFVPATGRVNQVQNFFAKGSYGLESVISYKFKFADLPILTAIKPYAAADRLQVTNGRHYQATHEYAGLSLYMKNGFQLDVERTFTQTTDHLGDQNWVRLRYDF